MAKIQITKMIKKNHHDTILERNTVQKSNLLPPASSSKLQLRKKYTTQTQYVEFLVCDFTSPRAIHVKCILNYTQQKTHILHTQYINGTHNNTTTPYILIIKYLHMSNASVSFTYHIQCNHEHHIVRPHVQKEQNKYFNAMR